MHSKTSYGNEIANGQMNDNGTTEMVVVTKERSSDEGGHLPNENYEGDNLDSQLNECNDNADPIKVNHPSYSEIIKTNPNDKACEKNECDVSECSADKKNSKDNLEGEAEENRANKIDSTKKRRRGSSHRTMHCMIIIRREIKSSDHFSVQSKK